MAEKDGIFPPKLDVQVLPSQPGNVTAVPGTSIVYSPGQGNQQPGTWPGGSAPPQWGGGWPIVMPQPSVIVVTVEQKKETDKKEEKRRIPKSSNACNSDSQERGASWQFWITCSALLRPPRRGARVP